MTRTVETSEACVWLDTYHGNVVAFASEVDVIAWRSGGRASVMRDGTEVYLADYHRVRDEDGDIVAEYTTAHDAPTDDEILIVEVALHGIARACR